MAVMLPQTPHAFELNSKEDIMFNALALLSDDYYVFHSFRVVTKFESTLFESETDFVIFNRKKGLLSIEAKAGHVKFTNGEWFYGNSEVMKNGGPFNQSAANKWKLKKYIENGPMKSIINHCKMLNAVWFPSISDKDLNSMVLPPEADKSIILTSSAIFEPEKYISNIFSIELPNQVKTLINENEANKLIETVLCPSLNIIPYISFANDIKINVFHRLLDEQIGLLNYLEDQRFAVINGVAGTGKTMIAIEKARRHANEGDKVLFLCYNSFLKNYLGSNFKHENIDYYTIDGFACKINKSPVVNYRQFKILLEDIYYSGEFEYQHVVIDEGQDFGQEMIEEAEIIDILKQIIIDNTEEKGTFYIFYDKLQLIQGKNIPKYIAEADCKLTLYKNCRNTENIATTSMRPLQNVKPKLFEGSIKGSSPLLFFSKNEDDAKSYIDGQIQELFNKGITDIVILTGKTEEKSLLFNECNNGFYKNNIKFTTCRKFKGLEADSIILIDVDKSTFSSENRRLFYVGASRARLYLSIIAEMSSEDCKEVLSNLGRKFMTKKPLKEFASMLNSVVVN